MGGTEEQPVSAVVVRRRLRGDERFAVTGASGWLGRTALDLLAGALGAPAFAERVVGYASARKSVRLRSGLDVPLRPLAELSRSDPPPTHILHFAYQTRDRAAVLGLGPYVVANLEITTTVLDAVQRHRPEGVLVASSGAVYAADGGFAVDLTQNPYGSLKFQEEMILRRAAGDVGARSVVARVFSVAGAYMTKPELYVLGDLVLRALAGASLVLRSRDPVYRSYCAAADVVALGLVCLLGESVPADVVFDSGGKVVEVGELAERVRAVLGLPHLAIERSFLSGGAADRYVGDTDQMAVLASRYGLRLQSLDEQIIDTAAFLRSGIAGYEG